MVNFVYKRCHLFFTAHVHKEHDLLSVIKASWGYRCVQAVQWSPATYSAIHQPYKHTNTDTCL